MLLSKNTAMTIMLFNIIFTTLKSIKTPEKGIEAHLLCLPYDTFWICESQCSAHQLCLQEEWRTISAHPDG